MTDLTDEARDELIARAEAIASVGVQKDDGYTYLVPASSLMATQGIIRELIAALLGTRSQAMEHSFAHVETAARAMFEAGGVEDGDWTWADVVREDPERAELWRSDARRVVAALTNGTDRD